METLSVTYAALLEAAADLLASAGLRREDAGFVAETLVESDLRGHHSHGVIQIPGYLQSLDRGDVRARGEVRVERRGPGFAVLDGGMAMGQLAARTAMRTAIELAGESAIGAVTVHSSAHYGAGAFWAEMAADAEMIGFTTSNEGTITVAAHGSLGPALVNSPFAWAIPAGEEPDIVIDMATGTAADGKISLARLLGQPMPNGWAIDREGRPTSDPAAVGAILPFGGPKGYALNVLCDVLSGALSGGDASTVMVAKTPAPERWSNHFFMALNVRAFTALEGFKAAVDRQIRALRAAGPAPGVARVYLPGERSRENRLLRLRQGIPMAKQILALLAETAGKRGVNIDWVKDWREAAS